MALFKKLLKWQVFGHLSVRRVSYRQISSDKKDTDQLLKGYDSTQVKLMSEGCLLVDENDRIVGEATKRDCHLLSNITAGMLHRAFSVFLFNSQNQLLLQQRADTKITYPGLYTNTCCSHPLSTFVLERDETQAMGVKRAAQRKLYHELGIMPEQIPLDKFHFVTRIQYMADNIPADHKFGENEIDYVLIIKKDVSIKANPNEVKSWTYVDKDALKEVLKRAQQGEVILTPWFEMICNKFLFHWWDHLDELKKVEDQKTIHLLKKDKVVEEELV